VTIGNSYSNKIQLNKTDENSKIVGAVFSAMKPFYGQVSGYMGSHHMSEKNIVQMCNLLERGDHAWEIGFGVPYLAMALAAVSETEIFATDINEGI
jgi:ubiquinone/menaquinone biosynthesis C-methylase UbiE